MTVLAGTFLNCLSPHWAPLLTNFLYSTPPLKVEVSLAAKATSNWALVYSEEIVLLGVHPHQVPLAGIGQAGVIGVDRHFGRSSKLKAWFLDSRNTLSKTGRL
jgi:hypothetical protein